VIDITKESTRKLTAAAARKGAGIVNPAGRNIFNGFFRAAFFRVFTPKNAFSAQNQAGNKSGVPKLTIAGLIHPRPATRCLPYLAGIAPALCKERRFCILRPSVAPVYWSIATHAVYASPPKNRSRATSGLPEV
jgi:hypothetical protein